MTFIWNYVKHADNKYEHRLIAEKALGKSLPVGAVIHHVSRDQRDNHNLVICQDQGYHKELHRRMKAREECGDANKIKCVYCKKYDIANNLYIRRSRKNEKSFEARHRSCHAKAVLNAKHRFHS